MLKVQPFARQQKDSSQQNTISRSASPAGFKNRDQILSARDVEDLIANGHNIVITDGMVLRLDGWLDKHPGGRLVVMHMVGRDATDEIHAYHSSTTLRLMGAYRIGRISGPWTNFTPPIRGGVFRKHESEDVEDIGSSDESEHSIALTDDSEHSLASSTISFASSATSLDDADVVDCSGVEILDLSTVNSRSSYRGIYEDYEHQKAKHTTPSKLTSSKEAYTSKVVQQEIDNDIRDYPSLDADTQQAITRKYQALHERVKNEGFYDCRYSEYGKEFMRYSVLFTVFFVALRSGWYITSAAFLGLFWHQIMFTAHDAGHRGITQNFVADTLIGMLVADFCCGLSIGWWKSSHNVHHLITNDPEHDPDIQNVPLFATSPSFFNSIHSSYYDFTYVWDAVADIAVQYQHLTYYPIMGVARFNLYLLSWLHLLSPRSVSFGSTWWTRPTEIAFMAIYWFLFGYCLVWCSIPTWPMRIAFVLVSHVITMPLHVQITLSHWGMSTADLGDAESFAQRQLRTTMDVDCPAWLDFIHGGLQFQAVHHLFPRVPRHNLRRLQVLVREFCAETEIEYKIFGFVDGNKHVLGRLDEVGKQLAMMLQCQEHMAKTGESGLH